jgi:hypothetical protein
MSSPLIRWASLVVTDRRWTGPLAAMALGFGLFIGVALGPDAAGTLATSAPQVIEIPPPDPAPGAPGPQYAAGGGGGGGSSAGGGGQGGSPPPAVAPPATLPPATLPPQPVAPTVEETPPAPAPSAAAPAPEPEPEGQTLTGTVLHANPVAGSYTLVVAGGEPYAVHARELPEPGTEVRVPVTQLANGTYAEAGARRGSRRRASLRFNGVVTFVDPDPASPAYTVSRPGLSVLVHVRPPSAGTPAVPALGALVSVWAEIERPSPAADPPADTEAPPPGWPPEPSPPADPTAPAPAPGAPAGDPTVPAPPPPPASSTCTRDPGLASKPPVEPRAVLWERRVEADGEPFTYSDFAGTVQAICPATGELLLSADDIRQSGSDLVLSVPEGLDLTRVDLGAPVAATATIGDDGALELAGLASDERARGADDPDLIQGDLAR